MGEGFHEAVGWLVQAVEADHPGFVAAQVERARHTGNPAAAEGLARLLPIARRVAVVV